MLVVTAFAGFLVPIPMLLRRNGQKAALRHNGRGSVRNSHNIILEALGYETEMKMLFVPIVFKGLASKV